MQEPTEKQKLATQEIQKLMIENDLILTVFIMPKTKPNEPTILEEKKAGE